MSSSMDNKTNVPYQTYRSKKHQRSHSSTPNTSAAATPDLHVNSFFAHATPPHVPDSVAPQRLEPLTQPNLPEVEAVVSASCTNTKIEIFAAAETNSRDKSPIPAIAVSSEGAFEIPGQQNHLLADTPEAFPAALSEERDENQSNQIDGNMAVKAIPTSVASTPPTSTFRRLSSRPRTSSEQHSPVTRTSSAVANSSSFRRVPSGTRSRVSSDPSRVFANSQSIPSPITASSVLQPSPIHTPQPSSNLLSPSPQSHLVTPSPSIPQSTQSSRPSSTLSSPATSRRSTSALPYRPGFQPKGIYRQRTDDFIEMRSSMREKDKVEVRRLERRLEKLIQLHFPREITSEKSPPSSPNSPNNRRSMSFLDIGLTKNPSEIWREVVEARMQASRNNIRAEEQYITPWQPDSEVSQCPHCSASFHPLTNRKHHCRLCGRVVCSLPVRHPVRKQPCSILFVLDQKTSLIEEVGEGVDYGVRRRTSSNGNAHEAEKERDDEKFLKGVRVCKTCRIVLRRQQYQQEAAQIPTFVRLHDTLVHLEKEIEDALGKFQESIVLLSATDPSINTSSDHASVTVIRKRLLESFASYDRLSKRIAQLPTTAGSQSRVQNAVLSRATFFLQNNMLPLQSLSNLQPAPSPSPHEVVLEEDKHFAETLQPLLEQEALLEGFIEEAKAQRKFEDAKTLKANLEEIREEIKRVASEAGAS